jgi:hypothetical protein
MRRQTLFYVAYGAALLILITFALAANAVYGQLMWIEHRDYPGGPAAYFKENSSIWIQTLGSAADVTGNVLGDALLVSFSGSTNALDPADLGLMISSIGATWSGDQDFGWWSFHS